MNPLISIIVPIYNVEEYLETCIESILNQTYKNLEIILVDDGSPDNCGLICDAYEKKDPRVRVIHKKNGGLSDARNTGIDFMHGDYVGFVDPDDWIERDMYEYLLDGIRQYEADIAVCGYYNANQNFYWAVRTGEDLLYKGSDSLRALLCLKIGNYAWNKLYKASLFNDIRYPKGVCYEDVLTTYRLFEISNSVVYLNEPKYYYRQNNNGIVAQPTIANKVSSIEARIFRYKDISVRYKTKLATWSETKTFLLNEIFVRYCAELRTTICKSTSAEYNENIAGITRVVTFIRDNRNDILNNVKLRKTQKGELHCICMGKRLGWFAAGLFALVRKGADRLNKNRVVKKGKKIRDKLTTYSKRSYYYDCLKRYPIEDNAALVESRGAQDFASNIYYITQELSKRGFKVYLSVWKGDLEKVKKLLATWNFNNVQIVFKKTKGYYRAFATAKYLFNDMVYEDIIIKREGQIWTNVWHGTPLKTLEYDVRSQRHELGGFARELLKTDYLAVPSEYLGNKLIASSMSRNLARRTKILFSGYPRNQVFFDKEAQRRIRRDMSIEDKEVFVFMPTWRGSFYNQDQVDGDYSIAGIMSFFERNLNDNQVLYAKLHNLAKSAISFDEYTRVKPFPDDIEPYQFLSLADCLITDYSSVFFDFANTGSKILLFVFDETEYMRDRGLYISLEDLPFKKVRNYDELREELNTIKYYDDSKFIRKFCTYDCPDAARKLVDTVTNVGHDCIIKEISGNGKENVLVYDTRISYRPYYPEVADAYLKSLDTEKKNYYYCFRQKALKETPSYLHNLKDVGIYTLSNQPVCSLQEKIHQKLTGRMHENAISREQNREMYGMPFDEIVYIDSNPYDQMTKVLNHIFI